MELLEIVFIILLILRLLGVITISWWWVWLPFFAQWAINIGLRLWERHQMKKFENIFK